MPFVPFDTLLTVQPRSTSLGDKLLLMVATFANRPSFGCTSEETTSSCKGPRGKWLILPSPGIAVSLSPLRRLLLALIRDPAVKKVSANTFERSMVRTFNKQDDSDKKVF
eukprot:Lithocolla_globosa_v1_NODE_392_length_4192_cov_10.205463.p2 type:complete len:110 gc:universal NODE_392_length_4192_cov_10.205463:2072-1743(-)